MGPDLLSLQHGLKRTGVLEGRPVFSGGSVRVAVLDSAPEITHPELERVRVQALPEGPPPTPALHGTLVTGVIAALEGNAFGIAGVAPEADVVVIPVCAPTPGLAADVCRMNDVLRGIDAAWQSEARIVSFALVGPPDPLLQRAIERLEQLDMLVVAAAGNEGGAAPRYPAAYAGVIGVGAIDTKNARSVLTTVRGHARRLDQADVPETRSLATDDLAAAHAGLLADGRGCRSATDAREALSCKARRASSRRKTAQSRQ